MYMYTLYNSETSCFSMICSITLAVGEVITQVAVYSGTEGVTGQSFNIVTGLTFTTSDLGRSAVVVGTTSNTGGITNIATSTASRVGSYIQFISGAFYGALDYLCFGFQIDS